MSISDDPDGLFAGRFLLGHLLGVGGSAAVYEAEDRAALEVAGAPPRVALKVLHQHLSMEPRSRAAFLAEASAAVRVRHPNVAAVLDAGVDQSAGFPQAWIAAELVPGGSLADRVALDGPLDPVSAAAVLDGVLAALGAIHTLGLVHRDVTPANVLLARPAGAGAIEATDARLTDFGLAEATGRPALATQVHAGSDAPSPSADVGVPGAVVGSAHYLSPEQAMGKPVRATGDLYEAGAVLYFALTGRPPYPLATIAQVLEAHVSAPPPVPSALVPAARPLDRVVTHAMAKVPSLRYHDAADFRAAIAHAVAASGAIRVVALDQMDTSGDTRTVNAPTPADGSDVPTGTTRVLEPATGHDLTYLRPTAAPGGPSTGDRRSSTGGAVGIVAALAILGLGVWGALAAAADPTTTAEPVTTTTASAPATVTAMPTSSLRGAAPTTDSSSSGAPTPELTPAEEPTSTAATTPTGAIRSAEAAVPDVTAQSVSDAQRALEEAGLVLGAVTRANGPDDADLVLSQTPAAGGQVARGFPVDVTIATGTNTVPTVTGLTRTAAAEAVRTAGFVVAPAAVGTPAGATVARTEPEAGTPRPVGATITLVTAQPAASDGPTTPSGEAQS